MNLIVETKKYASADDRRAWVELGATFAAYFTLFAASVVYFDVLWLSAPFIVLLSFMMLRIYIIQHDCSHRSFFSDRALNDYTGTLLSAFSMTPYHATRYIHGQHHSHVSDLDRRDTFEIYVMTTQEWQEAGFWRRLGYRLYRHPLTLILVGPFLFFALVRRFPKEALITGLWDVILHNLLVGSYLLALWTIAGWDALFVWVLCFYLTSVVGAFVSYVVHNFEEIHWGVKPELDFETAALDGSSVLDWGRFFDLVSMNIAYHDLHHLNAKIPGYKLKQAHQELEAQGLFTPHKIGLWDSIKCLRWKLYDEVSGVMTPFPNRRLKTWVVPAE
ncbi:MAG: fatty acid desaturase [Pseudomonadota bacterium]